MQKRKPFYKRQWFLAILSFAILQCIFILMELTGWVPRLREIDGKLFEKITDLALFNGWFSFYETPYFNEFTVFSGVIVLIQVLIEAVKYPFSKKSKVI